MRWHSSASAILRGLLFGWFFGPRNIIRRNKNALIPRWFLELSEYPARYEVVDGAGADLQFISRFIYPH
jgi:hypothetical protein